jgi:hypothetical protein
VLALRDYYQDSERTKAAVGPMTRRSGSPISVDPTATLCQPHPQEAEVFATPRHSATAPDVIQSIPRATIITEDRWTLQYIRVDRLRYVLDAIDTDVSGFITVNEVNAFTQGRPSDWRWALVTDLLLRVLHVTDHQFPQPSQMDRVLGGR